MKNIPVAISVLIVLFVYVILPTIVDAKVTPPPGWRMPGEADYKGGWAEYRDETPVPFHVQADFNGDGLSDEAWLLISTQGKGWGLFVFFDKAIGGTEIVELYNEPGLNSPQNMGITFVETGKYKTACGKGYWDCKEGEPAEIELKNPAINFFNYEGANSFFYWDDKSQSFKEIAVSD
ncbi:MAG: hypothetical protein HZC51_12960 [Nitrospirae bacterium]|nr:hypothetical protein [Nitrospirota bacterium]